MIRETSLFSYSNLKNINFQLIYILIININFNHCVNFSLSTNILLNSLNQYNQNLTLNNTHFINYDEKTYYNDNNKNSNQNDFEKRYKRNSLIKTERTISKLFEVNPIITNNNYESTCPEQCSCLGDYFECKKLNLKNLPTFPSWIRELDLSGNKLDDTITDSIDNLSHLTKLSLRKNHLRKMPVFQNLFTLEELILSNNKIQAITTESMLSLPNLRILDLSRNEISIILPNSFPVKNSLEQLNLNSNKIVTLDVHSFSTLTSLIELQINRNGLDNLPNNIFKNLKNLKKFELDSNLIRVVGKQGFYNIATLNSLNLSNNSIATIDLDIFEFTQNIIFLDLSKNQISDIKPQHFSCLKKLQQLNLSSNNLYYLNELIFQCTINLQSLDLSNNKLSAVIEDNIGGTFKFLKNLKTLNLYNNNIRIINQKAFNGLQNLQELNLNGNNISTIYYDTFDILNNINKLIIKTDKFICDCNMQTFYKWLKNFLNKFTQNNNKIDIKCDYPTYLNGKNIIYLKLNQLVCNESTKPRLINEPNNQVITKGKNVTFKCEAVSMSSAKSYIEILWRKDNTDLQSNQTYIETKIAFENDKIFATGYLHLINASHIQHSGRYQCIVRNNFGTIYSQKFKITVSSFPNFLKIPYNVTINSGDTARLECKAIGEPKPEISWQKDGGNDFPAARERRMHVVQAEDAFFIVNAKVLDMGVYTCTADNPAGIISANATVIVNEPPYLLQNFPIRKEIILGHSFVVECLCNGTPKPNVVWYKDDKLIKPTSRYTYTSNNQLLIITSSKLNDSGLYKCKVYNEFGTKYGVNNIIVKNTINHNSDNIINIEEMIGIIMITVICCAIGTSVIWVVIIYQAKKAIQTNPVSTSNENSIATNNNLHSNSNMNNTNNNINNINHYNNNHYSNYCNNNRNNNSNNNNNNNSNSINNNGSNGNNNINCNNINNNDNNNRNDVPITIGITSSSSILQNADDEILNCYDDVLNISNKSTLNNYNISCQAKLNTDIIDINKKKYKYFDPGFMKQPERQENHAFSLQLKNDSQISIFNNSETLDINEIQLNENDKNDSLESISNESIPLNELNVNFLRQNNYKTTYKLQKYLKRKNSNEFYRLSKSHDTIYNCDNNNSFLDNISQIQLNCIQMKSNSISKDSGTGTFETINSYDKIKINLNKKTLSSYSNNNSFNKFDSQFEAKSNYSLVQQIKEDQNESQRKNKNIKLNSNIKNYKKFELESSINNDLLNRFIINNNKDIKFKSISSSSINFEEKNVIYKNDSVYPSSLSLNCSKDDSIISNYNYNIYDGVSSLPLKKNSWRKKVNRTENIEENHYNNTLLKNLDFKLETTNIEVGNDDNKKNGIFNIKNKSNVNKLKVMPASLLSSNSMPILPSSLSPLSISTSTHLKRRQLFYNLGNSDENCSNLINNTVHRNGENFNNDRCNNNRVKKGRKYNFSKKRLSSINHKNKNYYNDDNLSNYNLNENNNLLSFPSSSENSKFNDVNDDFNYYSKYNRNIGNDIINDDNENNISENLNIILENYPPNDLDKNNDKSLLLRKNNFLIPLLKNKRYVENKSNKLKNVTKSYMNNYNSIMLIPSTTTATNVAATDSAATSIESSITLSRNGNPTFLSSSSSSSSLLSPTQEISI
ncbi:metacaspase-2-like isoform X2 [Condylostylus longicornis]|uniref:metacaspase-2-like isoform X2 n=1 Tax=Condylostylus longicornis TaxID=2530218 RepID=UPI00244DF8D6|nr:metacaspase-2-like isoform X2 [Condylostylus longicornis]